VQVSYRFFFNHSVAYVFGSINRGTFELSKIITEFSKLKESPGNPKLFHFKIYDSVDINFKNSYFY